MTNSERWVSGGNELFDYIDSGSASGAHLFERSDGEALVVVALDRSEESGDVFLGSHVGATRAPYFHMVVVEGTSSTDGHRRVRTATAGSVRRDELVLVGELRRRFIRWWNGDDEAIHG